MCWECGSLEHQKRQCPQWLKKQKTAQAREARDKSKGKPKDKGRKARLAAAIAQILSSEDEGEPPGLPGGTQVPPEPKQ